MRDGEVDTRDLLSSRVKNIQLLFNEIRDKKSGKFSDRLNYYLFVEEDFRSRILYVERG